MTATPEPGTTVRETPDPIVTPSSADAGTHAATTAARLAFTSYLRVIAIAGVVLIHVAGLTYGNAELRGTPAWWVAALATFSTKWAVPTFVMVSGALLLTPPADRSPTRFYRRRASRIGIPLVFWHAVYITIVATVLMTEPKADVLLARVLRGEAYTGLYFFWLILGLYLVTPLLWPITAAFTRRQVGVAGAALAALAAAHLSTMQVVARLEDARSGMGDPSVFTQFVPYVGFFLLGYALRDVVVRGAARLTALAVVTLLLCLELTWQVTGPYVFGVRFANLLNIVLPLSYQGWLLGLAAVCVFLLVRSLVHPASRLAGPVAAARARRLGDLTFGVFATHLLVLVVVTRVPGHEWPRGATTLPQLVVLCGGVLLLALALTWVLTRIPVLRRVV